MIGFILFLIVIGLIGSIVGSIIALLVYRAATNRRTIS